MKKIINYLKKYWPFIVLTIVVTLLVIFKLSQRPPSEKLPLPSPAPEKEAISEPQSKFSQLLSKENNYNILLTQQNFAGLPSSLPVYKTKKFTNEKALSRFAKIVVDLGFLGSPNREERESETSLVWREGKNYFNAKVSSGQFTFVGKSPLGASGQKYDSKQIQTLVKQQLISWELISEETLIKEINGLGIAGLELIPVGDLTQASVFQIILEAKLESYPLIGFGPARNHIEVKIDTDGNLLSLFFNLRQGQKEIVDYYPLKSFTETADELKNGKGQIVRVFATPKKERSFPPPNEIRGITISSISIAYYETVELQDFYQPVFLLKGEVSLSDGKNYQAEFILPAISSQYLKIPQEHF